MEEEIWKQIPGYEGVYDASSFGRIRSSPGRVFVDSRGRVIHWKTKILREKRSENQRIKRGRDDARVGLRKDGICKDFKVARLVAMAFHGIPQDGMTVNHINGNWEDNRPENLEWLTMRDNIKHAREHDLIKDKKPIALVDENGNTYVFHCILDASTFLGRQRNYLYIARNRHLHNAYSVNGTKYRFYLIKDGDALDTDRGCE